MLFKINNYINFWLKYCGIRNISDTKECFKNDETLNKFNNDSIFFIRGVLKEESFNNNTTKKKIFLKDENLYFNELNDKNKAIEINFINKVLILDIDHKDKKDIYFGERLNDLCMEYNVYGEKSINGGLHLFLNFNENARNIFFPKIFFKNFSINESKIKIEFKKNVIIYPTYGYNILINPEHFDENPPHIFNVKDFFTFMFKLIDYFSSQNELFYSENVELIVNEDKIVDLFLKQWILFFLNLENNSIGTSIIYIWVKDILNTDHIIKSLIETNDDSNNSNLSKLNSRLLFFKKIFETFSFGIKRVHEENTSKSTIYDKYFINTTNDVLNDNKSIMNFEYQSNDDDLYTETGVLKIKRKKNGVIYSTNNILDNFKKTEPTFDFVIPHIEDKEVSKQDFNTYSYLNNLIKDIYTNLKTDNIPDKLLNAIIEDLTLNINILLKFLMENNEIGYGSEVDRYYKWISRYDKYLFTKLENFTIWNNFCYYYCMMINFYQLNNRYIHAGKYSKILFNDYDTYRFVTLQNHVGRSLTEEESMDEYFKQVRKFSFVNESHCPKNLSFYFFLIVTQSLTYIKWSQSFHSSFVQYIDLLVNYKIKEKAIIFNNEYLFKIKLENYNTIIISMEDDSDKGNFKETSYINILGFQWIKLESEIFKTFIRGIFPNDIEYSNIIKYLNKILYSKNYHLYNLKNWEKKIPFMNGIFDLDYDFSSIKYNSNNYENYLNNFEYKKKSKSIIFRNYFPSDSVIEPINSDFDIDDFLKTYYNTDILSLNNFERYSKEFCFFIKCLFGESGVCGTMGPYNYVNMLCLFINLSIGLLRTKQGQNCTILYGRHGANGKSEFIKKIESVFGREKCVEIKSAKVFTSNNDICEQTNDLNEAFYSFDHETAVVDLNTFKQYITETNKLTRGLYKKINRNEQNLVHYIFSTNKSIIYRNGLTNQSNNNNLNFDQFEDSFIRRCCLFQFLNRFRIMKHESQSISLLTAENIIIKKKETTDKIHKGFLYYILDVISVFDIGKINSDLNDIIMSPIYNDRIIGFDNFKPLNSLLKKYCLLDEISINYEDDLKYFKEINLTLNDLIISSKMSYGINNYQYDEENIKKILIETFGVKIENEQNQTMDGNYVDNQIKIKNIIDKNLFTRDNIHVMNISKNPHKNFHYNLKKNYFSNRNNFKTDQEFVNASIPIAHRFIVNHIDVKFFNVVSNLLQNKPINFERNIEKIDTYKNIRLDDFLKQLF